MNVDSLIGHLKSQYVSDRVLNEKQMVYQRQEVKIPLQKQRKPKLQSIFSSDIRLKFRPSPASNILINVFI